MRWVTALARAATSCRAGPLFWDWNVIEDYRAALSLRQLTLPKVNLGQRTLAGDDLDGNMHWVPPELLAELRFAVWGGERRVHNRVYLGLQEKKRRVEAARQIPDPGTRQRVVRLQTRAR